LSSQYLWISALTARIKVLLPKPEITELDFIAVKPKIDTTAFDAEKYAEVGASVTFACPVQRNLHPFATTLWYYNGVKVTAEAPDVLLSEDGEF